MIAMPTRAAPPRRLRRARGEAGCRRDRRRTRGPRSSHPRQVVLARYYHPAMGRFASTDPLADLKEPAGFDAYGYSRGNPISIADPSGLWGLPTYEEMQSHYQHGTALPPPPPWRPKSPKPP